MTATFYLLVTLASGSVYIAEYDLSETDCRQAVVDQRQMELIGVTYECVEGG